MDSLDVDLCKQLGNSIEELTTSRPETTAASLKKVKNICRQSDEYVKHTYHLLMHQLEQDHAEIRLYTLNVVDELFRRSHVFREMLLADFQTFMELTIETDPDDPLPPPKAAAQNLKSKACHLIQQWNDQYSCAYKQLKLGYKFLKDCKKIDFSNIQARSLAEQRRQQQEQERKDALTRDNAKKAIRLIAENQSDIEHSLTEFDNAFRLLMSVVDNVFTEEDFQNPQPSCSKYSTENLPSDFDKTNPETNNSNQSLSDVEDNEHLIGTNSDEFVRLHGLGTHTYSLPLEISIDGMTTGVKINKDNRAVVITLKEVISSIVNKHLPAVTKWVQVLSKSSDHSDQLKKAIDMKEALRQAVDKYKELKIPGYMSKNCADDDDDSDDEFEEVPEKEGYEAEVKLTPATSVAKNKKEIEDKKTFFEKTYTENDDRDPTTQSSNMKALIAKISKNQQEQLDCMASSSKTHSTKSIDPDKRKLLNKAPILRFDVDLLRWNEKLEAPTIVKNDSLHRFWVPREHEPEIEKSDSAAALRTRKIEFTGDFKPVKWQCRTPLPSGKLCPRYDRKKCPFHGLVIPRDETGKPTSPEDIVRLKKEEEEAEKLKPPDWQDPELLRDIKAATGVDLTVGKKSKKGSKRKRQYPELTDLKEETNTTRRRLEKKVLNKITVKRISSALDAADYSKHRDKFGEQFNYSLFT